MLKILFVLVAFLFSLSIILGKLHFFKMKDATWVSDYIAFIAGSIGVYSVLAFAIMFRAPLIQTKAVMLFFAASPFLLGSLATYKLERFFTISQILLVWTSIAYVILYV
jgi:hypothetical protein